MLNTFPAMKNIRIRLNMLTSGFAAVINIKINSASPGTSAKAGTGALLQPSPEPCSNALLCTRPNPVYICIHG